MLIYNRKTKFMFCFIISCVIYFGVVGVYNKISNTVIQQNEENKHSSGILSFIDR